MFLCFIHTKVTSIRKCARCKQPRGESSLPRVGSLLCRACAAIRQVPVRFYTPTTKLGGVEYWIHPICLSVCLSVRPLTFCVRPVASTVQDGFFPYSVQMFNSMGGCATCDDHWPWPISSRSFGLDLENRVRSIASTVLMDSFKCLAQMITIIRWFVTWYILSESGNFNFWQSFDIFGPWP